MYQFFIIDGENTLTSSTRRSSDGSVVEQGRQHCSHMLYHQSLLHQPFTTSSYGIGGGLIGNTSPSATSGSTEPLQQLYDEMYNLDRPLVTFPGTFSPLPPSSPTPITSASNTLSRRFSYPNSPVHMTAVANGPSIQNAKINLPHLVEPTSNIAAVVAAAAQGSNTAAIQLQISNQIQKLQLHQVNANESVIAAEINQSNTTGNASNATNLTLINSSNSSLPHCLLSNTADSNSSAGSNSSTGYSTGSGSNFSERAAAAKNRWKAKGSITQGHVPQRQTVVSGSHNLKAPHANLAHSHSFDDAFESGKGGSSQLLHRRNTHHRQVL